LSTGSSFTGSLPLTRPSGGQLQSSKDSMYSCLPRRSGRSYGVVKIFALTRGVHAPRPTGPASRDPIPLSCEIALELKQKSAFLKNPAAPLSGISASLHQACRESSTVRNSINFLIRSLTPQQATGNTLAVQFKGLPRSMKTADIRIAFARFKELMQKGRTNTFLAYSADNP
jgi:hypothetical protein